MAFTPFGDVESVKVIREKGGEWGVCAPSSVSSLIALESPHRAVAVVPQHSGGTAVG